MFTLCSDTLDAGKNHIGGTYSPDPDSDWVILRDGKDVGRISRDFYPQNDSLPWVWNTWVHPAEGGRVDTLEEAQEAVRQSVSRVLKRGKDG